jgi:anti-anti-sigma factor
LRKQRIEIVAESSNSGSRKPANLGGAKTIAVGRSGDWMPPEELRALALEAVAAGAEITVDLQGLDHLDASSLQVLLAFAAEQKKGGKVFWLANSSTSLRRWFDIAGAIQHLSLA